MFFSFGPFDFAQGNACFNRWLECFRCTEIGRAVIFDNLVSDFDTTSGFRSAFLIVGASAFARGFGVTGRRDEFRLRNSE
jgi:hypothetical protein